MRSKSKRLISDKTPYQKIIRVSNGWKIAQSFNGQLRRSQHTWRTRSQAQTAIDNGYLFDPIPCHYDQIKKPIIKRFLPYEKGTGKFCIYCQVLGDGEVQAHFSMQFLFDREYLRDGKKPHPTGSLSVCSKERHGLNIGDYVHLPLEDRDDHN